MKSSISPLVLLFVILFGHFGMAQEPNNNGQLDQINEFSTKITVPFTMPDGVDLMTDIFVPITQDSQVVEIDIGSLISVPGIGSNTAKFNIIPKGTQLFIYDSIRTKNGQMVANPNPYSLPIVFTRTPYNKEGDEVGRAISLLGYAYALQDMRGRYSSEGVYMPMYSDSWNKNPYHPNFDHVLDVTDFSDVTNSNKHEDGYNSVRFLIDSLPRTLIANAKSWLSSSQVRDVNDPICNGNIGMFGASALANTQYQAAAAHRINPDGPGLKCLLPIVGTNEHFKYTGYQNGVFRDRIVTGWVKGQILDGTNDDLQDNAIQNNTHTSFDYGLKNKFTSARLGIDHFASVQYDGAPAGYYPDSPGRTEMDASRAPVNKNGESVGCLTANGDTLTPKDPAYPHGCKTGEEFRLPNLNYSRYNNMQVPSYHLSGWWDIFTDGQIETWRMMRKYTKNRVRKNQKIVIGPWAHQTTGGRETGDLTYPENVSDILGIDINNVDIDELNLNDLTSSEVLSWFRMHLNYNNEYKEIGAPTVQIPKATSATSIQIPLLGSVDVKVPSEPYKLEFSELLNYFNGTSGLSNVPIQVEFPNPTTGQTTTIEQEIDIPETGEPVIGNLSGDGSISQIERKDFTNNVPNVRFYVVGPQDDGRSANQEVGNYWFATDTFPVQKGVQWKNFYLHQDGDINFQSPQTDEGYKIFVHDPDNPVRTMGGGNMIVKTPDGERDAQGQMNLANPDYIDKTMNHPGVVSFSYEVNSDSLSVVGYPEVTLYAKSNPAGVVDGPTDTDFFVRVLDVYPDGREFFVVEGAVNARARNYARSLLENPDMGIGLPSENDSIAFTNIQAGKIYEYKFRMMPIGYTWGQGHKIKVLISSSNFTRYQVNPNLPIEKGEFFRRKPGDGQTYTYKGKKMSPREAVQRVGFSPKHPTHIKFPVYNKQFVGVNDEASARDLDIQMYPNPASKNLTIQLKKTGTFHLIIRNIKGQEIKRTTIQDGNKSIDVEDFEKGAYLIQLTDEDQKVQTSRKIMIQ